MDSVATLLKTCHDQPSMFNDLFLNRPAYWSRQIELCESVVNYRTTVAYSGNMVGKDYGVVAEFRGHHRVPGTPYVYVWCFRNVCPRNFLRNC